MRFTGRAEGDLGHGGRYATSVTPAVEARRRAVLDRPWTWLRQVHGAGVVVAGSPGDGAGSVADAAVTDKTGGALAVLTADCAPVALAAHEGVVGVAHAGWAGLEAGVLQRTVEKMRGLGASRIQALIGPRIGPECYQFGEQDLDRLAATLGDTVRALTSDGTPALDLPAAIIATLTGMDVDVADTGICTACSPNHFSWRRSKDWARQAAVVWQ